LLDAARLIIARIGVAGAAPQNPRTHLIIRLGPIVLERKAERREGDLLP